MSDASGYTAIGGGVLHRRMGPGGQIEIVDGRPRYRFMDDLYLPAPTDEIGVEALCAVNRWREALLADHELPHRTRIRRVAEAFVRTVATVPETPALFEIGCGKFPIVALPSAAQYVGLEVDEEAVRHNSALGYAMAADPEELPAISGLADTVVALFALQFRVPSKTFARLATLAPRAVLLVNIPSRDETLVQERIGLLVECGYSSTSFSLSAVGAHDTLVVGGGPGQESRTRAGLGAVQDCIAEIWPGVTEAR